MRRRASLIVLATFVLVTLGSPAPPAARGHEGVQLTFTVMSRNVYIGADLTRLITSSNSNLLSRMRQVFKQVQRSDFEARAQALADEIEQFKPLLIGLQEVALWRTQDPGDGPLGDAQDVAFDFLQILLDELDSRGLNYEPLVIWNGFDLEAPGEFGGDLIDVRFTDRDVILGRVHHHFDYSNPRRGRFDEEFGIPGGFFGDFVYKRAWQSVEVRVVGSSRRFRFINTHLEVFSSSTNEAQVEELLNDPADVNRPVIMVGDFNAPPTSDSHDMIMDAGFKDAWEEDQGDRRGFTCCQSASLRNDESRLSRRIDYVFVRGGVTVRAAKLVGEDDDDRTASGLWPSDHAGVVAKLRLD